MNRFILTAAAAALLLPAAMAADEAKKPAFDGKAAQDLVYIADTRPLTVRLYLLVNGQPFRAAWDEFIAQAFTYLDADSDGSLTKAEAGRAPPAAALLSGAGAQFASPALPASADAMDADRDGKVTRAELGDYYKRAGISPFQLRSGNGGASGAFVFQQEAAAAVRMAGQQSGPAADAINKNVFAVLDADKDGKLSAKELADGVAKLQRRDATDDEILTPEELLADFTPAQNQQVFVAFPGQTEPTLPADGPFIAIEPNEPGARLARRLLTRYGGPAAKKLSAKQFPVGEAAFGRLDADGDGELDVEELARFGRQPPDVEVVVRLGKRGEGEPAVELHGPAAEGVKVTPGKDGVLLDLGVTRIELRSTAEPQQSGPFAVRVKDQYKAQFKAADGDNNGYLSETEANANPLFGRLFKLMDRDGDGMLFEKEVDAYMQKSEDLQSKAAAGCTILYVADQGNGVFDLLDGNKDGRLTQRELRQLPKLAERFDKDGDGQFALVEVPRSYQLNARQGTPGSGLGGVAVALRGVGGVGPGVPDLGQGPMWFRKMDRNRDSDVSRREFLGPDEEFAKIDADGDGLISAKEAEDADRRYRGARQP